MGPPPHAGASHSSHVSHAERRTCERHFQPSDPVLGSRADPFPGGRLRQPTSGCFSSSSPKKQERGWEPGGGSSLPGPSGISRTEVGRCFALPAACVRGLSPELLGEAGGQRRLRQQSPPVSLLKVPMGWGRGSCSGRSSSGSWEEDLRSPCPRPSSRCLGTLSSVVDKTDREHHFPLCQSALSGPWCLQGHHTQGRVPLPLPQRVTSPPSLGTEPCGGRGWTERKAGIVGSFPTGHVVFCLCL